MKYVFKHVKHQDVKMFGLKLKKYQQFSGKWKIKLIN